MMFIQDQIMSGTESEKKKSHIRTYFMFYVEWREILDQWIFSRGGTAKNNAEEIENKQLTNYSQGQFG